jgi:hypothetical protein
MGILTERRTPMPVHITPTGGYASKSEDQAIDSRESYPEPLETYQTNAAANGCRKRIEDIYNRI